MHLAARLLTERPQSVQVGQNTSSVITLSTGSPQGSILSPLLFTLMTHNCILRASTSRWSAAQQHEVPGGAHHRQPHLVCVHWGIGQEGTAMSALPAKDESPPVPSILTTFYRSTIESTLTSCISMWCGSCKASDWRNVRRVMRTVEKISGTSLPSIQDITPKCCMSRAGNIIRDHPHHELFSVLASGKRFCSIRCRTTKLYNSFFPHVIRLLNSQWQLSP